MRVEELRVARELKKRADELQKNLEELRILSISLSRVMTGLPGAPNYESRVEKMAIKIADGERELSRLAEEYLEARRTLTQKIMEEIAEPVHQTLLLMRYVECLSYRECAKRMNFSERQIFRVHQKILKRMQEVRANDGK